MPTALRIEAIEFEKGCGTRLHCRRRVTKQRRQFGQSLLRRSRRVSLRWRGDRGRRWLGRGGGKGLRGRSVRACREAATRLALVASECRRLLGSKRLSSRRDAEHGFIVDAASPNRVDSSASHYFGAAGGLAFAGAATAGADGWGAAGARGCADGQFAPVEKQQRVLPWWRVNADGS